MNRFLFAAVACGALAAAAAPAPARAPSTADRGGMDWLLRSLQADREVDARGPAVNPLVAMLDAYRTGDASAPFENFAPVADVVKDAKQKYTIRDRAVTALLDRIRLEFEKKTDLKVLGKVRSEMCKYLLKMVVAEDLDSRTLMKQRVIDGLMPGNGVDWKADDPLQKRVKAYNELQKKLR